MLQLPTVHMVMKSSTMKEIKFDLSARSASPTRWASSTCRPSASATRTQSAPGKRRTPTGLVLIVITNRYFSILYLNALV